MREKRSRARTHSARTIGKGANMFLDTALHGFFSRIGDETTALFLNLENLMMRFRKRLMRKMLASLLIGIATMILFTASLLYLVQFGTSWATALLIVGIVMFAIALIISLVSRRQD